MARAAAKKRGNRCSSPGGGKFRSSGENRTRERLYDRRSGRDERLAMGVKLLAAAAVMLVVLFAVALGVAVIQVWVTDWLGLVPSGG